MTTDGKQSISCFYPNWPRVVGADKTVVLASPQDLLIQGPLTVAILIVRYILEKYCFTPLGKWLKISDTKMKSVIHNDILEAAYKKSTTCQDLSSIAKKVELSERQVERWWRLRRSQDKPSTLVKFSENMWKFIFYLCNFTFGIFVLWDKEWLWDGEKMNIVNSGFTTDIWWYYMVSSAFYWSLTFTQFWDVRRKDFWQMFVHHIVTIALLSFSWITHLHRAGSVVLLLHDLSDIPLELTKVSTCVRRGGTTPLYVTFVVTWLGARLVLFPYCIVLRATYQVYVCKNPLAHMLNVLLWLVLALDLFWTCIILRVMYNSVATGQVPVDERSSGSESEELDQKGE